MTKIENSTNFISKELDIKKQNQLAINKLCQLKDIPNFGNLHCERYYYNFFSNITITHFLDNITDYSWMLINIDREKHTLVDIIKISNLIETSNKKTISNYNEIFRTKDYKGEGQSFYLIDNKIKYENVTLEFDKGRKIKITGGTRNDCENQNLFKEILDDILIRKIYKPILIQ